MDGEGEREGAGVRRGFGGEGQATEMRSEVNQLPREILGERGEGGENSEERAMKEEEKKSHLPRDIGIIKGCFPWKAVVIVACL